jgi:hypothetical protein
MPLVDADRCLSASRDGSVDEKHQMELNKTGRCSQDITNA